MITLRELVLVLLGAGLVMLGVVTGAIADRIRGNSSSPSGVLGGKRKKQQTAEAPQGKTTQESATERLARDVIGALVTAGYSTTAATDAVHACAGSERATLETWTRAALRRAMKGA